MFNYGLENIKDDMPKTIEGLRPQSNINHKISSISYLRGELYQFSIRTLLKMKRDIQEDNFNPVELILKNTVLLNENI